MWCNWDPCALLVRTSNGAATVGNTWWFLKNLSIKLSCDLAIVFLGAHPGELKAGAQAGAGLSVSIHSNQREEVARVFTNQSMATTSGASRPIVMKY